MITIVRVIVLSMVVGCAAATPLTDLAEDMVQVPRSEVARVNEVLSEMREINKTLMGEVIDLQRERSYLKAKLGCV